MPAPADQNSLFLSTLPSNRHQRRLALAVALISALLFVLAIPFAKQPLPPIAPFIPIYEAALILNDLITAILLFGQFNILRTRSLLVLASGYLFTALVACAHMLTFPGLFAPGGLLGAGPQSTAWLYMFWHGGFPIFVMIYVGLNNAHKPARTIITSSNRTAILASTASVMILALSTVVLTTTGQKLLPAIMHGNHYTPAMLTVVGSTWAMSLLALIVLGRQRVHSTLDIWLMVVMCAWIFDIALSAVFNAGRFDLGFYAGRIYGLLAASFVLLVLLLENGILYAQLARSHQNERQKITELEQLSSQLEHANRELQLATAMAEKANQAKSAFLSSMSHELRTPLNAILGFAQLLTSETIHPTPVQQKEFCEQILKAGKHLLTLINEILDLAKIESGTLTLSLESVQLADVMNECHTMIEPLAARRNIQLEFQEEHSIYVTADRTRLKQILLNLLSNAIKYNRDRGTVAIGSRLVEADRLRITIQDTGLGLTSQQIETLFQPFNRLGQESGSEEGTGIGLVVTQRLVTLMGGHIGVSSTVGIGSEFWIELQLTQRPTATLDSDSKKILAQRLQDLDLTPATLLYIEDNPINLKLVEEIVHCRPNLHLLSAFDAQLGIELARAHLPSLILMDINLPGISGHQALQILQGDPATAHIPVIALTANAMPRDVVKGLEEGFFRYLTKPINIDEFTEAIDSALASAAPDSAAASA